MPCDLLEYHLTEKSKDIQGGVSSIMTFKRILPVFLTLVIILSLIPFTDYSTARQSKISNVVVTSIRPNQIDSRSTIKLEVDINEYLPVHSWIKITFPDEWTIPNIALPNQNPSSEDKNELERIITCIYLSTSPCTSCQGLPYVKNVERDGENSIQFWTHLELTPDGPYDPIPITVASRAGFVNAKIPGKYRLCVSTEKEQEDVCSNEFDIVSSQVDRATITLTDNTISNPSGYNIIFNVGEGGSLEARSSRIKIRFPEGTRLPEFIEPTLIRVNDKPLAVDVSIHHSSSTISFITPVDIEKLGEINIEIPKRVGIVNTDIEGLQYLTLSTNYEPTPVESLPFKLKREGQKPIITPPYTNQNASYKFAVFSKIEIEQNDLFEILFPQGTFIPRFMSADKVSMNGIQCMLKPRTVPDENKIQLYVPEVMPAGSIMVEFAHDSGLINPEIAGDYTLSYRSQTASEYLISDPYSIIDKTNDIEEIKITPMNASAVSTWIIKGTLSFEGALEKGDTIKLTFPQNATVPDRIDSDTISINGVDVSGISTDGNTIILTLPVVIESGGEFEIVIKPSTGIENPDKPSTDYNLKLATSRNATPNESIGFFIAPPMPRTTLLVNPPDPDGKNGWYLNPPSIDFECTSDSASIYLWWNWKEDQAIEWTSDDWLPLSDEQRIDDIYYYAEDTYGIEEPKVFTFKVDTVGPTFTITQPIGGLNDKTREDTYEIFGTADATELFKYDDPEVSCKVVPAISVNGNEIAVIQPPEVGLEETIDGEGNFSVVVDVEEGINEFVIHAEDEAGNFIEKTVTIEKDTIPPTIKIVSPEPGYANNKDEIEVKGTTEPGAIVTINNDFVPVKKDGTFTYDYIVFDTSKIEHKLTYSAEDSFGNKTEAMEYSVWFGSKAVIPTTGAEPTVNGVEPTKSSAAYVSSSGKTMVPLRYLAEDLMGATVGWDRITRTATISSANPSFVIVHKIGTTHFTKTVNGKTTRIDIPAPSEIKDGSTYLPMREFIEKGLGLKVEWNDVTRTATVDKPGDLSKGQN